jgi:hypothetical protein
MISNVSALALPYAYVQRGTTLFISPLRQSIGAIIDNLDNLTTMTDCLMGNVPTGIRVFAGVER